MIISRPDLLRVALTDAEKSHLNTVLKISDKKLLKTALQQSRPENLRTALTEADLPLLGVAVTKVNTSNYIFEEHNRTYVSLVQTFLELP